MINVNEYFDGSVKSLGYTNGRGRSSVGVIAKGEYEFGTSSHEIMLVVEGTLEALLPGSTQWQTFTAGQSFEVEADSSFRVKSEEPVSYLCKYR